MQPHLLQEQNNNRSVAILKQVDESSILFARPSLLKRLVLKKIVIENQFKKARAFRKWDSFRRQVENFAIRGQLKIIQSEIEGLRFQESVLRANFRVQKNELESRLRQMITAYRD